MSNETKTIKEWLQELPEPYNLLALSELNWDSGVPQEMEDSHHGALHRGFDWRGTGYYNFWRRLHRYLLGDRSLHPIPEGYLEAKGIVWPKEDEAQHLPGADMHLEHYIQMAWELSKEGDPKNYPTGIRFGVGGGSFWVVYSLHEVSTPHSNANAALEEIRQWWDIHLSQLSKTNESS